MSNFNYKIFMWLHVTVYSFNFIDRRRQRLTICFVVRSNNVNIIYFFLPNRVMNIWTFIICITLNPFSLCDNEIMSLDDLNEKIREVTTNNVIIFVIRKRNSEEILHNEIEDWDFNLSRDVGQKAIFDIPRKIRNLYYCEVDKYGNKVYSKWLYSLRDVAMLFHDRFNIELHIGE